jgi:hypothetical protein
MEPFMGLAEMAKYIIFWISAPMLLAIGWTEMAIGGRVDLKGLGILLMVGAIFGIIVVILELVGGDLITAMLTTAFMILMLSAGIALRFGETDMYAFGPASLITGVLFFIVSLRAFSMGMGLISVALLLLALYLFVSVYVGATGKMQYRKISGAIAFINAWVFFLLALEGLQKAVEILQSVEGV